MKKNNRTPVVHTMPRHESQERSEPPSPQALIERRRAEDAAAKNPLAFSMGEPLPGRSALDKMRAKAALDAARKASEAGDDDTVIVLHTASEIEDARRRRKGYPPINRDGTHGE